MPYTLAYKDRYRRVLESLITSDTSNSIAFASIPDNVPTKLVTEWTGKQFTKLFSSVYMGANLMFPEEANEIIWQLLKVVHQPQPLDPDGDCIEYSPSSPFIFYHPDNPFVNGDYADGWYNEAWFQFQDFFSLFPDWAETWIGGQAAYLLGYEPTDVLCNIAALGYVSWQAFFNAGGVFPKIQIKFSGTGHINLTLLSFPMGGKAVIELDEEPNILDILTGGVLDPNAFMVELNRDIVSFPPDEYPIVQIPLDVTTEGEHTLYINFIPIVNDEAIFLGFGGGIRSVEMCGFTGEQTMGIEQIFWDGCALKQIVSGVESTIVTAEEIEACIDIPSGGGGGGGANVRVTTFDPILTDATTTNTAFTQIDTLFNITPIYSKMLVIVNNFTLSHSAAGSRAEVRIVRDTTNIGTYANVTSVQGTTQRQVTVSDLFENVPINISTAFQFQMRVTAAGTATYNNATQMNVTVIEFENAEDLYQQDTRYLDGVLQKKIGGIWIDVVDIDALLAPIQSTANAAAVTAANAQSAANAAQSTANGALSTANSAVTVNNTQNNRLTVLEGKVNDIETIDIPQINLTLSDHETRISALEAISGGANATWGGYKLGSMTVLDMHTSQGFYSNTNSFTISNPRGWVPEDQFGLKYVNVYHTNGNRLGAARFARVTVNHLTGADNYEARVNGGAWAKLLVTPVSGSNRFAWIDVPPSINDDMFIEIQNLSGNDQWRVNAITYLFVNYNPFTLVQLP